jgi:prepilin-type N-terminal cleavage/methylation domain-containing protein
MKHPMFKNNKGFTLIELLVVIAIIGILAAMVITNLRTARAKARNASAITSMSSARAEAENFYDGANLSYTGLCPLGTYTSASTATLPFEGLLISAAKAVGGLSAFCSISATAQDYVAYVQLIDTNGATEVFCIDGTGFAGKFTAATPPGLAAQKCN